MRTKFDIYLLIEINLENISFCSQKPVRIAIINLIFINNYYLPLLIISNFSCICQNLDIQSNLKAIKPIFAFLFIRNSDFYEEIRNARHYMQGYG